MTHIFNTISKDNIHCLWALRPLVIKAIAKKYTVSESNAEGELGEQVGSLHRFLHYNTIMDKVEACIPPYKPTHPYYGRQLGRNAHGFIDEYQKFIAYVLYLINTYNWQDKKFYGFALQTKIGCADSFVTNVCHLSLKLPPYYRDRFHKEAMRMHVLNTLSGNLADNHGAYHR